MSKILEIIQKTRQIESTILDVKSELRKLKNRVRAYKGWTKRYRQQKQELEKEVSVIKYSNKVVCRQRDEIAQDLYRKQEELLNSVQQAKQAKELRDKAILELDQIISRIEEFKGICERISKTNNGDNFYLIEEANRLFFDPEKTDYELELDEKEYPQMFTDQASINRSLLN